MRTLLMAIACIASFTGCSLMTSQPEMLDPPQTTSPLSWADVMQRKSQQEPIKIDYGPAVSQFGRLFLPKGEGPFPVALLIHGGCWLADYTLDYFDHWAAWFADRGYASWSIEYRRLGEPGGGWPGTLLDVAHAADHLRELAQAYPLDISDVTVLGHSAGGQLALWLAARGQIDSRSVVAASSPVLPQKVIGLAAITDLAQYRVGPAGSCHASVDRLLGGSPAQFPQRYHDSSPMQQLPLAVPIRLISGEADSIVRPQDIADYVHKAKALGADVQHIVLPGAGHFDTGVPTPASIWAMCQASGACR